MPRTKQGSKGSKMEVLGKPQDLSLWYLEFKLHARVLDGALGVWHCLCL